MKRIGKALLVLLALGAMFAATFWIPSSETIAGPKFARLETLDVGGKFGVSVQWWDIILNGERFRERLAFGNDGKVALPVFRIQTSLGRRFSKYILTSLGLWPGCEHCYGPWVHCSLYHLEEYSPPKRMRLAQGQHEQDGGIVFTAGLLPDESQYEPRPFAPADQPTLLAECRSLIAKVNHHPSILPRLVTN